MRWPERIEWYIAAVATVLAVYWHWVNLEAAGGLWRDEAHTAALAQLPTVRDIWEALPYDSFPALSTIVLRAWGSTGWGATDVGLRTFGLLVGLGMLAALWLNAWRCADAPPTLSLLLWGLSPLAIRFGDALRPLGWGILMIVLAWGLIWKVVEEPRPIRVGTALLASVAAVQSLYPNAVFVLMMICAGMAIAGSEQRWRTAAILLAIGMVSALSLVPYIGAIRQAQDWASAASSNTVSLAFVWQRLWRTLGREGTFFLLVWWTGIIATVFVAVQRYVAPRTIATGGEDTPARRGLSLYCAVTFVGGAVAQTALLAAAGVFTQPWHYLPLVAIGGTALDCALGPFVGAAWLRSALLVIGASVLWVQDSPMLRLRQTNLDLVAAELNSEAASGDLIVVAPWYHGVTFHRYYHGPAEWTTLPPFEETKLHRYDELKRLMSTPGAHVALLNRVAAALQSGHRVWMVGDSIRLLRGQRLPREPVAPDPELGWDSTAHLSFWSYALGNFLQLHEQRRTVIDVGDPEGVLPLENSELSVSEGWR